jgi:CheY-like chemotaxis protein/anti-sigma regulatory factor (Ser/Thr protein kinase)
MSQSGLISYSPVNIHCNDFLQLVADENKPFASQKNIHVSLSCNEHIWCYADEQMVRIAIRNLFHNSLKFTPEGGMISIHCTLEETCVKIEIIDTGVGMDAATIEKLFEVNNVISEKGTRDEEGRGLGLLVVKDFILRNKGSIEVLSKKKNGSNFIVRLPIGNAEQTYTEPKILETIAPIQLQSQHKYDITVVIVDDNDLLRNQLSKSLSEIYNVVACANATEAIEVLKTNKVHIVISDIIMGEIDGISLCNIIKQELHLPIPIILITGIESVDAQVSAYNSGADDFIKKPFELDVLIARIQNLLAAQNHVKTSTFDIGTNKLKPQDEVFAEKLRSEVEKGIPDPDFSVEILAQRMGTSRANLFKKTKKSIGISPSDYIHHARLEVASVLLKENKYRIAEVAYMVGYSDPLYFSSCFSKHYGVSPSDYKGKI